MKVFSDTVALAWPTSPREIDTSVLALADVRNGNMPVEIRIGIGPLHADIPLRVLGYAGCVTEVLQGDIRTLIEPAIPRLKLFSSAPKALHFDPGRAVIALVALAGALRLAGVSYPIGIDLAASDPEIPVDLDVRLGAKLTDWVAGRAIRHRPGETPSFQYAFEHAAPTMFADIADSDSPPFRVTVGGASEARFWAVRMHVRIAVAARGARLAPAAGVIIKALRVPWYQPLPAEPPLVAAHTRAGAAEAVRALAEAANPACGGNGALRRESRAASRLVNSGGISELIDATSSARAAMRFARDKGFDLGTRLVQTMGDD